MDAEVQGHLLLRSDISSPDAYRSNGMRHHAVGLLRSSIYPTMCNISCFVFLYLFIILVHYSDHLIGAVCGGVGWGSGHISLVGGL